MDSNPRRDAILGFYPCYGEYYTSYHYYQLTKLPHRDPWSGYLLERLRATDDVLEVGTEAGMLTLEASRLAASATGLAFSEAACRFAEELRDVESGHLRLIEQYENTRLASDAYAKASFVAAEPGTLPFPDAGFSFLFGRRLLDSAPDPLALLEQMLRCLRPGGQLLLEHALEDGRERLGRSLDPIFWRGWAAERQLGVLRLEEHKNDRRTLADLRSGRPIPPTCVWLHVQRAAGSAPAAG